MFDNRCGLTGVVLYGDVIFVLLTESNGGFTPCSLPLRGTRNPYTGGFEAKQLGANGRLICDGIARLFARNALRVDYAAVYLEPFEMAQSAEAIERFSVALYRDYTAANQLQCDGRRLTFSLVSAFVYDSLVRSATSVPCQPLEVLQRIEPATSFYGADSELEELALTAASFRYALRLIEDLGLKLNPISPGEQFGESEARAIWRAATETHKANPAILRGLHAYGKWEGYE